MPDRRRRSAATRRSVRHELRLTRAEARALAADADRLTGGNVSALLLAAWRAYSLTATPPRP